MRLHNDALAAKKSFWEILLRSNIDFNTVAEAVATIDETVCVCTFLFVRLVGCMCVGVGVSDRARMHRPGIAFCVPSTCAP